MDPPRSNRLGVKTMNDLELVSNPHMRKTIDEAATAELRSVLDGLRAILGSCDQVPP